MEKQMEEVKFKIWYPENRCMSKGLYIWELPDIDEKTIKWIKTQRRNHTDMIVIRQYIEKKDMYNKEIYKGDILKCWFKKHKDVPYGYDYCYDLIEVKYNKEESRFEPSYYLNSNRWTIHKADILCSNKVQVEIVGNIYENPKLLKKERD